jgi:hypothetical protein
MGRREQMKARLAGEREYCLTARRIARDADSFLRNGDTASALKILSVVGRLDENDVTIAQEVK